MMTRVKMRLVLQHSIMLLGLLAILGCARVNSFPSKDPPSRPHEDYIVFGLSVICATVDSHCLEERFNGCLGQTRIQHIRENGRPVKLTILTSGGAIAEWPLRGSKGKVTFTYDMRGIAREWSYDGIRTHITSKAARNTPPPPG
jgi:hypothetical protein